MTGLTSKVLSGRIENEAGTRYSFWGYYWGRDRCKGKGVRRRVELKLKEIIADFLAVELGTVDAVLGMQWLDTIGTMRIHWPSLTMTFWKGRQIVPKGDPSLIRAKRSLKTIEKTWEVDDQGFLLEWTNLEMTAEDDYEKDQEMRGDEADIPMIRFLLQQYADIFETPKGLPPKREIDHRILTLPEQRPINVRPYRYGHVQREEIEKLVAEMLQTGVIRPSRSPYSSPVLLVKKKDGGWRFYVDYRKLNQATISDKFPISIQYLGHQISKKRVEADEEKIGSMVSWPRPSDVLGLRGFLGLTGYYKIFVKGYGEIVAPLTELLQKNDFKWEDDAETAFEKLKIAMTTIPVLALPDWNLPFTIETDASGSGFGAVLSQDGHPIAFFNQKLSQRAQVKSI
ncbi:Retrovirus-related Pol polyprotein from transposon 297 family [Cucumis melo var. makuwa]|uniref:Retrovirus-related Pol polyprotein from transposon 297 family n=1 Tax=Cucumis melo var. makuwa TaxID=1194695 RepID=A0A5A7TAI9_CUCMM|nr:Retrovirus-related Pol polyprotein from transposon 297 family [Cucumis melo var. makuwa]